MCFHFLLLPVCFLYFEVEWLLPLNLDFHWVSDRDRPTHNSILLILFNLFPVRGLTVLAGSAQTARKLADSKGRGLVLCAETMLTRVIDQNSLQLIWGFSLTRNAENGRGTVICFVVSFVIGRSGVRARLRNLFASFRVTVSARINRLETGF